MTRPAVARLSAGWRFAVPPDHPDGLSGDLPMRFSSHDDPVASLR
jgi:protein TonB